MIPCTWDGDNLVPDNHWRRQCDKQFVVGQRYLVEATLDRSGASHNHYFARVQEAFKQLPAGRWLTPDHLRRWALIEAGYCHNQYYFADTPAEANRVAALARRDDLARVNVNGLVVRIRTAKSQS